MILRPRKEMILYNEDFGKKISVGIQSTNYVGKTKKIKKNAN